MCIFDKQRLFCLVRRKQFWSCFVSSCTHLFELWSYHMTSLECMRHTQLTAMSNLNVGKLVVVVYLRCVKNRLSHSFKPQHVVSLCNVLVTWLFQPFVFCQKQNSNDIFSASWGKIDSIFLMPVLGSFRSVNKSRSWYFKFFWSRSKSSRSLKAWSRSGVGVWIMWLYSSLLCTSHFIRYESTLHRFFCFALFSFGPHQ